MVLACLVCISCGSGSRGVHAWFVDSLIKVFPQDAVASHRLLNPEFNAARNADISIQIAVRSGRNAPNLTAMIEAPEDSSGHRIQTASIRQVGYVVVGSHTHSPPNELIGNAPGWYPDVLLPLPLELKAHWTRSLWIEIHVPAGASPGVYHGAIRLESGGKSLGRLPFRLRVFSAQVPEARSLQVTNWFSLSDQTTRQFFGVPAFSDGWWKLVENVARVFAGHRQNVVLTPLQMLIQPKATRGRITYDYTNFDRWVETFQQAGAIGYIEGSHLTTRAQGAYNGALQVPILEVAHNQVQQITAPAGDPRVQPFLTSFFSELYRHLKEKGWAGIYLQHISDEAHGPEIPFYAKFAAIIHHAMPGIQTIDAVDVAHMPELLQKNCDIWVPVLSSFDGDLSMIAGRVHSGHAVWYYTCVTPQGRYLNRFIDFPLVKTRLLPWLDFRYGLTGFLHWGGNSWTPEPILDTQPVINDNRDLLPAGDAFIYYPDRKDLTLYSSIRMENFLAGIEDYELLKALQKTDAGQAARLAQQAINSFTDYVRTPGAFRKIELQLLKAAPGS